jgi:predicted ATPase/class 3 adenylate cyclase
MAMAAPLPTGAVTFAFTDIEGSTARWEQDHAAMQDAVRRHDAILRAAVAQFGGHVFKKIGDAYCAAFVRPEDAVAAMLVAQKGLAAQDFTAVDGLPLRVALHTGTADERDGDYFGPALNRVARLLAIGHGGQVLLSGATRELARGDLPEGARLVDLGSHRLRDLSEPEHVWQLDIAGLQNTFPPLRSLDVLPNNLPLARTSFVGREAEVNEVKALLAHHRLLTLVGAGGVGKTRLAIQAGAELLDRYPDGVWFADLAGIENPELVSSVVAQAIGMNQRPGSRVDEAIPQWLKQKKLLLIIDNCEHVLDAIAAIANSILATAADVHIVATTRQALAISGEMVHRLSSLSVPADQPGLRAHEALDYGAVALFVDRAQAVDTSFVLTDDNAPIVAEVCRRLDGIALAIELAAARVKVLSIPKLAQRLNERFKLLTGGRRDVLPRQKTLTALIDWSYDLLTPREQTFFNRLGVFAGGFGFDAATAVCGDGLDELDVLDLLASLSDKSLVVADTSGESERYRLLESTAAYAVEKLAASGEGERTERRHAEHFRRQAEAADERRRMGSAIAWLSAVESDLDNYRAALDWALTRDNDPVLGAALVGALERLWFDAGLTGEGRYWMELALPRINEADHPAIAARLYLELRSGFSGQPAHDAAQRSEELFVVAGDRRGAARARRVRAASLFRMGRFDAARDVIVQTLATSREFGDRQRAADIALLGVIEYNRGELDAARSLYEEALNGFETLEDQVGAASVLGSMAELEFLVGNPAQALHLANEALEKVSPLEKHSANVAVWHNNSAAYRIALGDLAGARESARAGLRCARQLQEEHLIPLPLLHLALLATRGGYARRGAQLLGYVEAQFERLGVHFEPTEQRQRENLLTIARETMSAAEIEHCAAEGARFTEDQAVAEALAV